jgi:hypothetical protein
VVDMYILYDIIFVNQFYNIFLFSVILIFIVLVVISSLSFLVMSLKK